MSNQPKPEPLSAEELTVLCGDDPNTGAISRLWNNRKRVLATIAARDEEVERWKCKAQEALGNVHDADEEIERLREEHGEEQAMRKYAEKRRRELSARVEELEGLAGTLLTNEGPSAHNDTRLVAADDIDAIRAALRGEGE